MGSLKKLISILFSRKKINFPGKMPLKCSNNAQCFCLTKILEKMLQPVAEMLRHSHEKNNLSCFKSLLVTGLWDKILSPPPPPIQSCSSMFWAWSCIASNFEKGWRGDHKHKIMDRQFKPKYGTVSQVLLQLAVSFTFYFKKRFPRLNFPKRRL